MKINIIKSRRCGMTNAYGRLLIRHTILLLRMRSLHLNKLKRNEQRKTN